jgi:hypothetical protein
LEGDTPVNPPLLTVFHHHANTDTLLVEIDADILHDKLLVWKPTVLNTPLVYHDSKAVRSGSVSFS